MCKPLCEDEFRSAIEENYYSPNKFHFGLSFDQVVLSPSLSICFTAYIILHLMNPLLPLIAGYQTDLLVLLKED